MDGKGDDSGSDTLDQSLQRKCVVADDDSSIKQTDTAVEDNAGDQPTTEPGGNMSAANDSPASPTLPTIAPPPSSLSPSSSSSSSSTTPTPTEIHPSSASTSSSPTKEINTTVPNLEHNELPFEQTATTDSRGFESRVRQISNDLKDTTIADGNSLGKVDGRGESTATGTQTEYALPSTATSTSACGRNPTCSPNSSSRTMPSRSENCNINRTSSQETSTRRHATKRPKKTTKKVRFKLIKGNTYSSDTDDDDDDDDDDYYYEEVEIEEDEDKLFESIRNQAMQVPLSFVSPQEEEEAQNRANEPGTSADCTEEVEIENPPPEGGIQSVVGKLSQLGKIEYLIRYVDKPDLQWESEEVLKPLCPTLIKFYEDQRARERQQDLLFAMRLKNQQRSQQKTF